MILATGVIWVLTTLLTPEQFASFGWRIPFLFSVVLVIVGYYIRRQVEESPVFAELAERKAESSAPLGILFKKNTKEVILSALIFIGNNAVGYMIIAFFAAYASRPLDEADPSASTGHPCCWRRRSQASAGWCSRCGAARCRTSSVACGPSRSGTSCSSCGSSRPSS